MTFNSTAIWAPFYLKKTYINANENVKLKPKFLLKMTLSWLSIFVFQVTVNIFEERRSSIWLFCVRIKQPFEINANKKRRLPFSDSYARLLNSSKYRVRFISGSWYRSSSRKECAAHMKNESEKIYISFGVNLSFPSYLGFSNSRARKTENLLIIEYVEKREFNKKKVLTRPA